MGRIDRYVIMQADILDVMKDTFGALGIQTLYMKPPYDEASCIDFGIGNKLYGDFDYKIVMDEIVKECLPDTIYIFKNYFYMYHTIFKFPESIQEEYGYTHCVIGPMLFHPVTQAEFAAVMLENHVDEKYGRDLQVFYSRMPYLNSFEQWSSMVIGFCKHFFDRELRLVQDHVPNSTMFSIKFNSFSIQPEPDFSTETIEKRYAAENRLLEAVKTGNYVEATLRFNEFIQYRILPRNNDPIRDMKNLLFVQNTLLRKAVEEANVHPVYIDDLSRKIAIQIESYTSESQLNAIRGDMIRKYCLLVNNYSRSGYSALIRKCLDYVDFHYMEQISLTSLAQKYFVSNTHLSALFKKEVEINLKEYIQEVRLRQARIQLNTTRLPIQEIAANCGFLDVNYFTRVFRKVHGMSPREYRNKLQTLKENWVSG